MARGAVQRFRVAAHETIEETRQALIATAKREHGRIMQAEPKPQRFTRTVDGTRGATEEKVRADGRIVYDYHRLDAVVQYAMEVLFDLSPALSGEYRNAHTLFVDGVQSANLANWDGTGEVVIVNYVPYARKIELGKMTMRVPGSDHVYEQAEFLVHQRFGNSAHVVFDFVGIMNGAFAQGRTTGGKGLLKNQSDLRWPALRIWSR